MTHIIRQKRYLNRNRNTKIYKQPLTSPITIDITHNSASALERETITHFLVFQEMREPQEWKTQQAERQWRLSGFNNWGTPCTSFGHWVQVDRATEPRLSAPLPDLGTSGWPCESTLHLLNSVRGLRIQVLHGNLLIGLWWTRPVPQSLYIWVIDSGTPW
jgi:hypothetical protein